MNKSALKKLIDVAAGRVPADTVIKHCKVVDVYNGCIIEGDIALCDGLIAGVGTYEGKQIIDAAGQYAAPGFIDGHIHIESSYVSPEEIGRLLVPHGGTTIIADPHEIVNVCGLRGLEYMLAAAKNTALDVKYMLPSCVPATPFEHAGATLNAVDMAKPMESDSIFGLGEFMNYPGVIHADDAALDKLLVAKKAGKLIDGHSPMVQGLALNAYAAAQIRTDHECVSVEEMRERIACGMYVLLREGSACHDLRTLLKGVNAHNSRRCVLCSDDRQPKTMLELGHLDEDLRTCVEEGIDPIVAIQMASLNAAECFRLHDRGAITPGLRADIVLLDDLQDFKVRRVFIAGVEVARDGEYLPAMPKQSIQSVTGSFHVKDFSVDKLAMKLRSDKVNVIGINPGGLVTSKLQATITRDVTGDFVYDAEQDIVKVAVVERHQNTGNVALGFLKGYGITQGAIALSIAHDSHNIIVTGTNNADMAFAVEQLIAQNGGIIMVRDGVMLESMPMPIGGIMTDQSGEWVDAKLTRLHDIAHKELGVSLSVEPIMTLCFMALPVIPALKLTDMGLFDVTIFDFIDVEAE